MRFLWLSAFVVALDQATKATVLHFMSPQSGIPRSIPVLGDWLRFTFTENPGMAFGITVGPPGTVTMLSIVATGLVVAYIYQVRNGYAPYVWSLALILGGALGNIIDRVFYGVLLDYGTYFTGHVVDFIHVNLWKGFIPDVVPLFGGSYMELFPIWNVADMAIVIGVVGVLLFHRTFHRKQHVAEERRVDEPVEAPRSETVDGEVGSSRAPHASPESVSSSEVTDGHAPDEPSEHTPSPWPPEESDDVR